MPKSTRILHYTWEDLTGLKELDDEPMEGVRLLIRQLMADRFRHEGLLHNYFEVNSCSLLLRPTSDVCVVLYRLLEQYSTSFLYAITAIHSKEIGGPDFSFGDFTQLVAEAFVAKKKNVPIVTGSLPIVWLSTTSP